METKAGSLGVGRLGNSNYISVLAVMRDVIYIYKVLSMTEEFPVMTTAPAIFRTILMGWLLKLSNSYGKIRKRKLPAIMSVFTSKNSVVKILEKEG